MSSTPQDIQDILNGMGSSKEADRLQEYISSLESKVVELGGSLPKETTTSGNLDVDDDDDDAEMKTESNNNNNIDDDGFTVPQYTTGEDYDAQSDFKMKATEAKEAGKWDEALDYYNQAVQAAPPSALLYASRAVILEQLQHYAAAERDCNHALESNPDSAKALKVRGQLRFKYLKDNAGALSDLSQAQTIDYDPDLAKTLEELTQWRIQQEKEEANERIEHEAKLKKKAEDIKKARDEARRESAAAAAAAAERSAPAGGGMPGGMGGGMPGGMPDMSGLMSDPEIVELMQNPKVVAAFQSLMSGPGGPMGLLSNPQKLQEMMSDPEVGPALQKIMSKFMGGGGMGGMPGGMGGGFGGMGGDTGGNNDDDDFGDMPDLEEMPDID